MSQVVKIKTVIGDIQTFKTICAEHKLEFFEVGSEQFKKYFGSSDNYRGQKIKALVKDTTGYGNAYLVHGQKAGQYDLMIDNDGNYCSITKRLGKDGGLLTRDYAIAVIKKRLAASGARVRQVTTNKDQSITLRYAV